MTLFIFGFRYFKIVLVLLNPLLRHAQFYLLSIKVQLKV